MPSTATAHRARLFLSQEEWDRLPERLEEAFFAELAERVLARVRPGLQRVIDAFPAGGGWTEGMMYATTTLQHFTDFVVAHVNAGGDDLGLSDHYRLHEQLDARLWFVGGDGELINPSNC